MAHIRWDSVYSYFIASESITLADTARHFNIHTDYVRAKAAEDKWTEKKQQVMKTALSLVEERTVTEIAKRNMEHAKMGRAIQGVALEALATSSYKPKSFDDVRKGLETGIKIERQALGMDNKIYGKVFVDTPQVKYHVVWGDGSELSEY